MRTRAWIGNDIVDLAEPGVAGKERDRRFMERVFTPAERARILEAAAPTIALWKAWAAKETAYKIATKLRGKLVFAHRAFEVVPGAGGEGPSAAALVTPADACVRFEDLLVHVRWESARDYVHCIGQLAAGACARRVVTGVAHEEQALVGALTHAEQASVYSMASARARLLARRLMERWDLHHAEVLRLWRAWGWSAPMLARDGHPLAGFDVSLSHDGRFVAAALSSLAGR